jgi:hypothetical protein
MPVNSWMNVIAASGVVNNSLHVLLSRPGSPVGNGVVTYAWCDPTFSVIGTKVIDLSPLPVRMASKILQLGTETAIVFADGTVAAFPIPA